MLSDGTTVLSALCLGIALAGAVSAICGVQTKAARLYLAGVNAAFAGIICTPLVWIFAPGLYGFYLPFVFVLLFILPLSVFHYVVAKTSELDRSASQWGDWILPIVACIVMMGYWLQPSSAKTTMFVDGELPDGILPATLVLVTFVLIFCWVASSCWYLIVTLRRLRAYRAKLQTLYSNLDDRELRWLDWFVISLVALWITVAVSFVAENTGFETAVFERSVYVLAGCLLLFVMAFASIAPPKTEDDDPNPAKERTDGKYARSALTAAHAEQLADRIRQAMAKDDLYLDPNLSLQKLSRHVGALPNQISQTLNEQMGSTFFDYIAQQRVEAAKPLVVKSDESILAISLDVGFNSRSTFYKAFKRETGMTPKAYREAEGQPSH